MNATEKTTAASEFLIDLLHDMKDQNLLEDRREYDVNDLALAYELSPEDAAILYSMIQQQFAR